MLFPTLPWNRARQAFPPRPEPGVRFRNSLTYRDLLAVPKDWPDAGGVAKAMPHIAAAAGAAIVPEFRFVASLAIWLATFLICAAHETAISYDWHPMGSRSLV
jgi:hypothetical protein